MTGTLLGGLPLTNGAAVDFAAAVALKASALLALTGLLTLVLGRSSAALRHFLWTLGIVGALALPLISARLPWSWEVLPVPSDDARAGAMAREAAATTQSADDLARSRAATSTRSAEPTLGGTASTALAGSAQDRSATTALPEAMPDRVATTALPDPTPEGAAPHDGDAADAGVMRAALDPSPAAPAPGTVMVLAWAAVALLLGLHHLAGRIALARIRRGADLVRDPRALRALQAAVRTAGVVRPVRLLVSGRTRVPMTWGVRCPVVLLPGDWRAWSDERLRLVLQHEVAHVRRLDALTDALARIASALYWFNPLAWWAAARLRAESERASDDLVLRGGARASEYAGHLLELVTLLGGRSAPAGALPLAQRSQFEGRLLAILDPALARNGVRRGVACVLCAGLAAAVVVLGAVAPAGAAVHEELVEADAGQEEGAPAAASPSHVEAVADGTAGPVQDPPSSATEVGSSAMAVSRAHGPSEAAGAEAQPPVALEDAGEVHTARALAHSGSGPLIPASDHALDNGVQVRDSTSVRALVRALREDTDAEVRSTAAWALGQIEDPAATQALAEALRGDESVEVRRAAAWALGQIEDPAAAPALGEALSDEDAEVRRTALWALGQIESPEAVGPLSQALGDADPEARRTAAWALGQIESDEAVAPLAAALADEDAGVREQVVWALGQIESQAAVEPLGRALADTEPSVRRQAAWALGQIESEASVGALSTALQGDDDVEVRRQAAWALGQIESEAAVPALAAALADADVEVGRQAAWALGQVEPSSAPPELIEAARTGSGELKSMALWALVQIEDPAAVPALVEALDDEDAEVRTRALRGLADIGSEAAIQAIAELLQDPDPEVRAAAARALAGRGSWRFDPNPNPNPNPQPRPWPRPIGG